MFHKLRLKEAQHTGGRCRPAASKWHEEPWSRQMPVRMDPLALDGRRCPTALYMRWRLGGGDDGKVEWCYLGECARSLAVRGGRATFGVAMSAQGSCWRWRCSCPRRAPPPATAVSARRSTRHQYGLTSPWAWVEEMYDSITSGSQWVGERSDLLVESSASAPGHAASFKAACGAKLIAASVTVISCSPTGRPEPVKTCLSKHPDLTSYRYVLRRDGHWLFYALQGGG
jgi:hypothetical protein